MIKKIPWQWEILDPNTARAKVIGGWIVNHLGNFSDGKKTEISESMCFIPDRDHEWIITMPFDPSEESPKAKSQVKASDFKAA